ncbi:hypothetical protein Pelo_517 [Pelomyxa schiedti]|nr:hypothetical protein Pelo_517 [Pelomyxa schiedti]
MADIESAGDSPPQRESTVTAARRVVSCLVLGDDASVSSLFAGIEAELTVGSGEPRGRHTKTRRSLRVPLEVDDGDGAAELEVVRVRAGRMTTTEEEEEDQSVSDDPVVVVVVVAMVKSRDGRVPRDVGEDLRAVYSGGGGGTGMGMGTKRNLILVDCGIDLEHRRREAALTMAFTLSAFKLMVWSGDSSGGECLKGLIFVIRETAGIPGRGKNNFEQQEVTASIRNCAKMKDLSSLIPPGTALDITDMAPSSVRSVLQFLSPTPDEMERSATDGMRCLEPVSPVALRQWVQAKNWPAVTELILAQATRDEYIDLSDLHLDSVPEHLEGITCQTLDLRHNHITNNLPQWLFSANIHTVLLDDELIPEQLREERWAIIKHRMLFGEEPAFSNSHKLILLGDHDDNKAAFLKSMTENKNQLKTNRNQAGFKPSVLYIQQAYKIVNRMLKKPVITWTAWDLNRMQYPLYPCFFCSKSIFMLFFHTGLTKYSCEEEPRLHFWLDEISRCQRQADVRGNAQVILLGYSLKDGKFLQDEKILEDKLLHPILRSHLGKNITFCGICILSLSTEEGLLSTAYPFTGGYLTPTPVLTISELLEGIASSENVPASPRWINLSHKLSQVTENVIRWNHFAGMAVSCGVGVPRGGGTKAEIDLEMCCDFLSDTGSVIHFRHPLWSNSSHPNLSQIVVLKPKWFSEIMHSIMASLADLTFDNIRQSRAGMVSEQAISGSLLKRKFHSNQMADRLSQFLTRNNEPPGVASWLSSLLRELSLVLMCDNVPHFSFCLLPEVPYDDYISNTLIELWLWKSGSCNRENSSSRNKLKITVRGRSLDLGRVHDGLFPQLMNMVRQIPGVEPEVFWKSGLWVSKKSEGLTQDLFIKCPGRIGTLKNTSINIFMRTKFETVDCDSSIDSSTNLSSHAIEWLNLFCQDNNIPSPAQWFSCTHCLDKLLDNSEKFQFVSSHSGEKPHLHFFHESEVFDAALAGNEFLHCPNEGQDTLVKLSDIAPELSCFKSTTAIQEISVVNGKEINEEPSPRMLSLEVAMKTRTMAAVAAVISVLKGTPKHPNVVNCIGTYKRNGTQLMVLTEPFPLNIPLHLQEEILGMNTSSAINLRDLMKRCIDRGKERGTTINPTCFLDRVMPMSLRDKILRDVAQGLRHLHSQHPPLVHDGLFLENGHIWIASLHESGPGPWAKFSHLGSPPNINTDAATDPQSHLGNTGPELQSSGNPKSDVWNFGVLVHQLVFPLNPLVEVELLSATNATTNKQLQPQPPRRIIMHRSHLHTLTQSHRFTFTPIFTSQPHAASSPSAEAPTWAKQVMTCCWATDPASRPTMLTLLRLWDHI